MAQWLMTPDELLAAVGARRGHFALESGQHGERWLELDRLFIHRQPLGALVETLADGLRPHLPEVICGPLVGGAFVAQALADVLSVDFVYAERLGPPVAYRIPAPLRSAVQARRVAVVDDAIQAGSALAATLVDLLRWGADPIAIGGALVLGAGADRLAATRGLTVVAGTRLADVTWAPDVCPLCAAGEPLSRPGEQGLDGSD